ncbi:uncharacterized protein CMU_030970 [Cryptosporidium muris RN66]|uniref:Cullin family profile domain-containing protein n=1 Tax=Cryptosporidium muris (strain RN66) TaxID=441375 RepID=B6AIB5_CRYMR|nr:uncharacterized protein CMU_030970 [Cryptosporidium muris RN66]EEA07956.1 hypothetical protein, conserved [Cryptosporidium muris RN66]|eukprot:XP_002142305.1 hypothetical protein [Cryptosporidium muris RN66]
MISKADFLNYNIPSAKYNSIFFVEELGRSWENISNIFNKYLKDIIPRVNSFMLGIKENDDITKCIIYTPEDIFDESSSGISTLRQILKLPDTLNSVEFKTSLSNLYKYNLQVPCLELYLNNAFIQVIQNEVEFFWSNILVPSKSHNKNQLENNLNTISVSNNSIQSEILENIYENYSDINLIVFHYSLIFGLIRFTLVSIMIIKGALKFMEQDINDDNFIRKCFLEDGNSTYIYEHKIYEVIVDFYNKIKMLLKMNTLKDFEVTLDIYISKIFQRFSKEILNIQNISIEQDLKNLFEILTLVCSGINCDFQDLINKIFYLYRYFEPKKLFEVYAMDELSKVGFTDLCNTIIDVCNVNDSIITDNFNLDLLMDTIYKISFGPSKECEYNDKEVTNNFINMLSNCRYVLESCLEYLCGYELTKEKNKLIIKDISLFNWISDISLIMRIVGLEEIWYFAVDKNAQQIVVNTLYNSKLFTGEIISYVYYTKLVYLCLSPLLSILLNYYSKDCIIDYNTDKFNQNISIQINNTENTEIMDYNQGKVESFNDNNITMLKSVNRCPILYSNNMLLVLYEKCNTIYSLILIEKIPEYINNFPNSKKGIVDIYIIMNLLPNSNLNREFWFDFISNQIQTYIENYLLLLEVNTSKIVGFYIKCLYVLLLLEFPVNWLEDTLYKIGNVLRQRNDTTQCIVSWIPFLLENSMNSINEAKIPIPISCSDEGIYPLFSLISPNFKSYKSKIDENFLNLKFENPHIKLILTWITKIYGDHTTLLYDYMNNLASKVIGNWLEINYGQGFDIGTTSVNYKSKRQYYDNSGFIDAQTWEISEKDFRRDESVYGIIKMTMSKQFSTLNINNKLTSNISDEKKNENDLLLYCNVILQDINNSIDDNKKYKEFRKNNIDQELSNTTGITISRYYWPENIVGTESKNNLFPLSASLKSEIESYRRFFEEEHPGRTYNCYHGYGNTVVDLQALDGTIRTNVILNFLQVSIYEYISDKFEYYSNSISKSESASKSSSNTLFNWFALNTKNKNSEPLTENNIDYTNEVSFNELIEYFGLSESDMRWNIESMAIRGLLEQNPNGTEMYKIPESFHFNCRTVDNLSTSKSNSELDSSQNDIINDMTVMLDFKNIAQTENVNIKYIEKNEINQSTDDHDSYNQEILSENEDDEDVNLNFPTGIVTSTIVNDRGSTELENSALNFAKNKGISKSSIPPIISKSTYLDKHCHCTIPIILHSEDYSTHIQDDYNGAHEDISDVSSFDIIKECEHMIRATLQLNGAMAPAVLFSRVRTAMTNHITNCKTNKSKDEVIESPDQSIQNILNWSQHVQAINNLVDRGEVVNIGGRLFLEK